MKATPATIFFLSITITASFAQIILKGKINHYDGTSVIYYTPTLGGIYAPDGIELKPAPNGTFRIRYENEGLGTLSIHFKDLTYCFFHSKTTTINFTIDQAAIQLEKARKAPLAEWEFKRDSIRKASIVDISGDYKNVNTFYNNSIRTSLLEFKIAGTGFAYLIKNAKTPVAAAAVIDSLMKIEFDQINSLYPSTVSEGDDSQASTADIKKFLENEVRAFYSSIIMSGMLLKRTEQNILLHENPDAPLDKYNPDWEKFQEDFLRLVFKHIDISPNSSDINGFVDWLAYTSRSYRKYDFHDDSKPNDEQIMDELLSPDSSTIASYPLGKQAALAYRLTRLHRFLNNQRYYSPVLLNAVKKLKQQYPENPVIKSLEPQIEKLQSYIKSSAESFTKGKIIETSYVGFNDLLETLKGKNVLVDVWATWCGPCIEDFGYKTTLQPFLANGSLTILYISIDKERYRKQWRENINYNQLEGFHYQASDVFIHDMWKELKGYEGAIPRYALINRKGEIVLSTAARPSDGDELRKQIEEFILITDK